jgi:H+/gluconate symporter-like permease
VLESGLAQAGPILLLTGVGGGLAAVVTGTGLGDALGAVIGTGTGSAVLPILLAWGVAALLRTATGSPIAGAVAIAGVLGPVAGTLGIPAVLIAVAAGAGGIFGLHVNSNFFWMYQALLRLTTSGTLRSCTIPSCLASVTCLPLVLLASVITGM